MKFQTKNQVLTKLKQLAEDHLQIRGFGYGDRWELETAITKGDGTAIGLAHPAKQPFMWVTPLVGRVNEGSLFYDFEIIVGDVVKTNEGNELEVESDTMLICLDILSKLDDNSYDWVLAKQSNLQPFTEKWDSEFTGHIMNVSLEYMFDYDYCQVPLAQPDADIAAFLAATGIDDETQVFAITYLVTQLKQNGLWNRMHAIYPFVGGTAHRHSYNLKNVNQYRITWSPTGVSHNANGITDNGTSGYGDTGYIIQSANQNNFHFSAYVRNDVAAGTKCAIGGTGITDVAQLIPLQPTNQVQASINQTVATTGTNTVSSGYYIAFRESNNKQTCFKNLIKVINSSQLSTATPSAKLSILARNANNIYGYFADYNIAFATIGDSLNDSNANLLYNITQQFQQYLLRQV